MAQIANPRQLVRTSLARICNPGRYKTGIVDSTDCKSGPAGFTPIQGGQGGEKNTLRKILSL